MKIIIFLVVFLFVTDIVLNLLFSYNSDRLLYRELFKNIDYKNRYTRKEDIDKGYSVMKEKRAVLCTLARNVSKVIDKTKQRLELLGDKFKDYQIIIFENDSKDNTRERLIEWQKQNDKVYLIPCGFEQEPLDCKLGTKNMYDYGSVSDTRMEKMANFRNIYLDLVKNYFSDYDYMLVYDFDIDGPICYDGIASSFTQNWDAVFCNVMMYIPGTFGLGYVHGDTIAFTDIDSQYKKARFTDCFGIWLKMLVRQKLKPGKPLYPVKSAFGGIGIYRIPKVLESKARYGAKYGCEHVEFNEGIYKGGGKLYINPDMLVYAGRQGTNLVTELKSKKFFLK